MEIRIQKFDQVDSTNRVLMGMAKDGADVGTVVWARRQSTGRGRLGRSFQSPEGGVYVSLLVPLLEGFHLTAMAGVAVKRTISQVCNRKCGIKWVNDIILEGKKVCGILAQGAGDKVVLGIGVNYTTDISTFPEDVRDIACSIYNDERTAPPMETFVTTLAANVYDICLSQDKTWLEEYKSSSTIVGNKVQIIQAGKITGSGRAVSIDDNCFLHIIDDDNKEIVLSTGEVSVRNNYD
jgi:BirA family biotin operon repressor/biotin-[acetyl-CoA-carboxylase] ligase